MKMSNQPEKTILNSRNLAFTRFQDSKPVRGKFDVYKGNCSFSEFVPGGGGNRAGMSIKAFASLLVLFDKVASSEKPVTLGLACYSGATFKERVLANYIAVSKGDDGVIKFCLTKDMSNIGDELWYKFLPTHHHEIVDQENKPINKAAQSKIEVAAFIKYSIHAHAAICKETYEPPVPQSGGYRGNQGNQGGWKGQKQNNQPKPQQSSGEDDAFSDAGFF